ncbi:hypothetical protein [Streptomyces sp. CAU 1734]|uniref:hypothetical protein n=1 Tax=Streptomyces sp. CAU 1734 TaxID=3140360 RepID=UPI0032618363
MAAVDIRLMAVEEGLDGSVVEHRRTIKVIGQRSDGLEQKIDGVLTERRSVNATFVELLPTLKGRGPDAR